MSWQSWHCDKLLQRCHHHDPFHPRNNDKTSSAVHLWWTVSLISTHDEPFHPCYKWQTISSMLLITNHCTNVLMTNQQTHPFHGKSLQSCHHHKPFQPSHLRQTISPFHTWQTISPKLPMTNHFGFAIHEKLFPPITHMKKKNRPMMSPWETNAIMPLSEILSPIQSMTNHFTHSTMANYFTHATHDNFTCSIPVNHESYSTRTNHSTHATHHKPFHPSNPWHTIYQ